MKNVAFILFSISHNLVGRRTDNILAPTLIIQGSYIQLGPPDAKLWKLK
jgi:hypothetical protein